MSTALVPASGRPAADEGIPRVAITNLSKTFGRTKVLSEVNLTVMAGEIHGLLGQNGSGKSTLIKVLSGLHRADSGASVQVDGADVPQPITPAGISQLGVTIVHQTLGLLPGHSVTENIRLGQLRRRGWKHLISWSYERTQAVATLAALHAEIDPDRLIDQLHMGQRATVAIARAMQGIVPGQGCVILDESTQSLPREVLPDFYRTVRRLADAGTSILIVSHRLDEVLQLADRVTVLRDGQVTAAGLDTANLTEPELAKVILGRQLVGFTPHGRSTEPPTGTNGIIRIRGLTGRAVSEVDIDLRPGEVVGVTGPTEAGSEELPYLLAGIRQKDVHGTVEVSGRSMDLARTDVAGAQRAGIVLVPADRVNEGIAITMTAMENVTVPRVKARSRGGILRRDWQRAEFNEACAVLSVAPADPDLEAASFSGGNQQKLLLAKWLLSHPKVLILHEPTQAVDVGARADILRALGRAADEGAGVLLSSIEAQDLALVCDRVLVMQDGRIAREIHAPMTADDILQLT